MLIYLINCLLKSQTFLFQRKKTAFLFDQAKFWMKCEKSIKSLQRKPKTKIFGLKVTLLIWKMKTLLIDHSIKSQSLKKLRLELCLNQTNGAKSVTLLVTISNVQAKSITILNHNSMVLSEKSWVRSLKKKNTRVLFKTSQYLIEKKSIWKFYMREFWL